MAICGKGIVVLLAVYIDYIKKEKSKNKRCVLEFIRI